MRLNRIPGEASIGTMMEDKLDATLLSLDDNNLVDPYPYGVKSNLEALETVC